MKNPSCCVSAEMLPKVVTRSVFALLLAGAGCGDQAEDSLAPVTAAASLRAGEPAPLHAMNHPQRVRGRYIVRFKSSVSDASLVASEIAQAHRGRVLLVYRSLKGFYGELPDAAVEGLRKNPSVAYIEADVAMKAWDLGDTIQSNPHFALDRVDQRTLPRDFAYAYSASGAGVHVWIVDTGVDRNEPELAGRIDENFWYTNNGKDPFAPCHNHGTRVARVAAGTTRGLAKRSIVHSARVDVDCGSGDMNTGLISAAFEFIGDYSPRPAVANLSAGSECSWWGCGPTAEDAMAYARDRGVTVVVAAGNDGRDACDYTPAHTLAFITVGASNANDQRIDLPGWWASNYGTCVDMFAPVENEGGTSLATPMVTGAAALHLGLFPTASPENVAWTLNAKATNNVLSNIGPGSPNRLLYSKVLQLFISISGASTIGPMTACTWEAVYGGGQPAYRFEWRRDGALVSTDAYYSVPLGHGASSSFLLEVNLFDGMGRSTSASHFVTVDPENPEFSCS